MEKFKFDTEFTENGAAKEGKPRVKRTFRADEVDALTKAARAEGERSAVAEAERLAARALDELAKGLHEVLSLVRLALDDIHDDATRLAGVIGHKLGEHAFAQAPETWFEKVISECLELVRREPEICIAIPAGVPEPLRQRLALLTAKHGLPGTLRIEESASLRGPQARIDWSSGGAEISLEEAYRRMDAMIEERIGALKAERSGAAPTAPDLARAAG
ncbi:MAG: hypothetical protein U1E87_02160 [Alphaproteobacteria bacterium]